MPATVIHNASNLFAILSRMKRFFRILCAFKTTNAAARQKLRGVYRYIAEGHDWDIQLVREEAELTADVIRRAKVEETDGYLISIPNAAGALKALAGIRAPVVAIECDHPLLARRTAPTLFLRTDNPAIGRLAAAHFRALGQFGSYAFVHDATRAYWSDGRCSGFCGALAEKDVAVFAGDAPGLAAFRAWLTQAPRPVAVCAAWDMTAVDVLTCVRRAGLKAPEDVAVIGVDDDECLCTATSPSITTIRVNRDRQGYDAAAALGRMLTHRCVSSKPILCSPECVIERESTHALTPARQLVDRALRFIGRHACAGLTPDGVAHGIGVSRRLLDLRFRELGAETVQKAITRARFQQVLHLARFTSQPIEAIARRTGFPSANALRNLFKARTGCSLSDWRRKGPLPANSDHQILGEEVERLRC